MTEYWQRSAVTGSGGDGENGYTETEIVLHRRGEDPMVIAFRRNRALAGCNRIVMETVACFHQERKDDRRRTKADIPKEKGNTFDEWGW